MERTMKNVVLYLLLTAVLLTSALPVIAFASGLESPKDNPDVIPDVLLVDFAKGTTYEQMVERLSAVCRQLFPEEGETAILERLDVSEPVNGYHNTLCGILVGEDNIEAAYDLLIAIEGVTGVYRNYVLYLDPDDPYLLGDVNQDGILDVLDYIILKKALLSSEEPDDVIKRYGDVNQDGNLDSIDYIRLKKDILNNAA